MGDGQANPPCMSKALSLSACLRYVAGNTKRLRLKRGWTQEALAEEAGLEARYVQEIERAKTNMTLAVLLDLATALGVHPRVLLNEAELKPAKPGRPRKGRATRR
jgi:transcriptional regulator with XRE-family HTH domain